MRRLVRRRPTSRPRRVPYGLLALLFAAFVALSFTASVVDISRDEARLLWIVRDPERLEPAAIGDTVRLIGRNMRAMLDRADTRDLPLAVPLDVWTMLAGGSVFAARLPVVLLACLVMAVALRLTAPRSTRLARGIGYAVPVAGVLLYALSPTTLAPTVADYMRTRQPTEPVLTLFRDDSPLGYYQAQVNIRRGIGVDLGWQTFSDQDIERVVGNLGTETVWLVFDVAADTTFERLNASLLDSGRKLTRCRGAYTEIAVVRYAMSSFTPTVTCSAP